jgi:hypothetical protein
MATPGPSAYGGSHGGFREYRVFRSDEAVVETTVADVARIGKRLRDLVGERM